jgi:putative cell wall-binding protein
VTDRRESNVAKNILASLYEKKLARIGKMLTREQGEYRTILEQSGFKVNRRQYPHRFEAADNLVAEKGNVVLEVSQLLRGGNAFSVFVKRGDRKKTVRLFTGRLKEAIAFADAAQHLAR